MLNEQPAANWSSGFVAVKSVCLDLLSLSSGFIVFHLGLFGALHNRLQYLVIPNYRYVYVSHVWSVCVWSVCVHEQSNRIQFHYFKTSYCCRMCNSEYIMDLLKSTGRKNCSQSIYLSCF